MAVATILIVDSEPTNLSLLAHVLRPDYLVRAANSGESALRAVAGEPRPDRVLLDVMRPDLDAVLWRRRVNPATADIPVIFLTALVDDLDEERGLRLGAAGYIKPIKPIYFGQAVDHTDSHCS